VRSIDNNCRCYIKNDTINNTCSDSSNDSNYDSSNDNDRYSSDSNYQEDRRLRHH
jgi:hypothetical protein